MVDDGRFVEGGSGHPGGGGYGLISLWLGVGTSLNLSDRILLGSLKVFSGV